MRHHDFLKKWDEKNLNSNLMDWEKPPSPFLFAIMNNVHYATFFFYGFDVFEKWQKFYISKGEIGEIPKSAKYRIHEIG